MISQVQNICQISIYAQHDDRRLWSGDYTLLVPLKGEIAVTMDDRTYPLTPPYIFDFTPPCDFSFVNTEGSLCALITLSYTYIQHLVSSFERRFSLDPAYYDTEQYDDIYRETLLLIDRYFYDDPDLRRCIDGYIYYLREHCCREDTPQKPVSKTESRILAIRSHIENNYQTPLSLTVLAAELSITPQYLSAFISRHMHTSFNTYVSQVRLRHAVRELVNTNRSISQIAYACGFPNIAAMTQCFKSHYQLTPTAYRIRYKENLERFHIHPFSHHPFEQNRDLYLTFDQRKPYAFRDVVTCTVSLRPNRPAGSALAPIWQTILNLGYAWNLLRQDYVTQLKAVTSDLHFIYGRVVGLFHPDIILWDKKSGTYQFRQIDTILYTIEELGLIPMIVIGKPEPLYDAQGYAHSSSVHQYYPDPSKTFFAIIHHLVLHVKPESTAAWRFEISYNTQELRHFAHNTYYHQFIRWSVDTWRTLKSFLPECRVGGPGYAADLDSSCLFDILKVWKENGFDPDFFTIYAWPFESPARETLAVPLSSNPHILKTRLQTIYNELSQFCEKEPDIQVVETGLTPMPKPFINDSRYIAVFLLQNMIDLQGLCSAAALPPVLDLHYIRNIPEDYHGHNGILTYHGIKKPAWFVLNILNNLGRQILYQSPGVLITRIMADTCHILLYSYKHPGKNVCQNPDFKIDIDNYDLIYTDRSDVVFRIDLSFLKPGDYYIADYTLNKEHGSFMDYTLARRSEPLIRPLMQQLARFIRYDFDYRFCKIDSDTQFDYTLEPLDIRHILIYPASVDMPAPAALPDPSV